jgi:hypothetical protein
MIPINECNQAVLITIKRLVDQLRSDSAARDGGTHAWGGYSRIVDVSLSLEPINAAQPARGNNNSNKAATVLLKLRELLVTSLFGKELLTDGMSQNYSGAWVEDMRAFVDRIESLDQSAFYDAARLVASIDKDFEIGEGFEGVLMGHECIFQRKTLAPKIRPIALPSLQAMGIALIGVFDSQSLGVGTLLGYKPTTLLGYKPTLASAFGSNFHSIEVKKFEAKKVDFGCGHLAQISQDGGCYLFGYNALFEPTSVANEDNCEISSTRARDLFYGRTSSNSPPSECEEDLPSEWLGGDAANCWTREELAWSRQTLGAWNGENRMWTREELTAQSREYSRASEYEGNDSSELISASRAAAIFSGRTIQTKGSFVRFFETILKMQNHSK